MRINKIIGRIILVLLLILGMALLVNGQGEEIIPDIKEAEGIEEIVDFPKPIEKLVTRLDVTIIDGMNDKLIKLNNCAVQIIGELHICEDSFTYQNTFLEGDRYDITIHVRPKK